MKGITAETNICMVIGDPVRHSLSPAMHNAGYRALGIEDAFIYVACRVTPAALSDFTAGVRAMGIRGVSCGIPHKREIIKYLDGIDPVAQKIGAVNTVVNDQGTLTGFNTDWLGIRTPLLARTDLSGKRVALLGAGGAARAALHALCESGALVTIFNRTPQKAIQLSTEFGCRTMPWEERGAVRDMDIIVNTTSVGLGAQSGETPLEAQHIRRHHIVFDAVYGPTDTRLITEARRRNATVITGLEMLLHQGTAQFERYTGHPAPVAAMEKALRKGRK